MNILHINSYYIDNHLYSHLYKKLSKDVRQKVYVPIKYNRSPENQLDIENLDLVYDKIITKFHKLDYFGKIKKITKALVKEGLHKDIDFIHAHNLYTDGGVAYKLKKQFGIKYIVAIRLTDVIMQYKYMFHRRSYGRKILEEAEKVIFVSPIYKERLFSMMSSNFVNRIKKKTLIMPNGVNQFWLDNLKVQHDKILEDTVQLLFVGQIDENKNLYNTIAAVAQLNEQNVKKYILTIVGGKNKTRDDDEFFDGFIQQIAQYDWVSYEGKKDRIELLELYRKADIFVMPSRRELFGLVYIEALSQSTPVIYSIGEGISSFLKNENFGVGVYADDPTSIANGIAKIVNDYPDFHGIEKFIAPFNWNIISNKYLDLYSKK